MHEGIKDLSGLRFGMLVAIKCVGKVQDNRDAWLCLCDCGNTKVASAHNLKRENTKSCGCLQDKCRRDRSKHRRTKTRLYRVWSNMKTRCSNPKSSQYKWYGERGISVCKEWKDFLTFEAWALKNGYRDDLELDRVDCDGNYSPDNCRFISHKENCNNRRNKKWKELTGVN